MQHCNINIVCNEKMNKNNKTKRKYEKRVKFFKYT